MESTKYAYLTESGYCSSNKTIKTYYKNVPQFKQQQIKKMVHCNSSHQDAHGIDSKFGNIIHKRWIIIFRFSMGANHPMQS